MKMVSRNIIAWLTRLALSVTLILLIGCAVGPRYSKPPVETPPAYKEIGNWKQAQPSDQLPRGKWWEVFQDQQLNAFEDQIEVSNQNLKAAEAQYRQARALLRYNRADFFPTLTGGASATRVHTSSNRPPPGTILSGQTYTDLVMPFDVSYEADVWGRVRRNVEASREQAQASAADLAGVNLSMHSNLALFYFQARSLDSQEHLLNSTVADYEKALQLTQNRFSGGLASALDVSQAQTQLEATRAQATDIGVLRAQYEHAIATLIGKPASSFSLAALPLTSGPPSIPVGVPSQLLERRPDISSGERRVAAANAQIGVAKAAYFPLISLGGSGGFESSSVSSWLTGPSALWSLGPSAVVTLLDFGRRRAVSEQARAAYDQNVASYRETVLNSFQQVEDNLAALRILEQESKVQDAAVAAAQRSLAVSLNRYKGGLADYLTVTTAQTAVLVNQRTAVQILGERLTATVQLIQALGGSWNVSDLPADLSASR